MSESSRHNRTRIAIILLIFLPIILTFSCGPNQENSQGKEMDYKERIRLRQYLSQGRVLYIQNCANCHQKDGAGLGDLYPPLLNSDYMIENIPRTLCIISNGQEGEIVVNGKTFNQPMPANPDLTDLEIAEIATYIYNRFAGETRIITIQDVKDALENCERDTPE